MFDEIIWKEWCAKEAANYKLVKDKSGKLTNHKYLKKGYTHFDEKFWFPDKKEELKQVLKNGLKTTNKLHKRLEWWAFKPFVKILIKTPRYKYQEDEKSHNLETKIRPICFASHLDSLIFGYYSFALSKKYEKYIHDNGFSDCILAYRSDLDGKCNIQFSKEVFSEIEKRGACTALALDIKGYFDHINHGLLKERWSKILGSKLPEDQHKIYTALTQYSYVKRDSILKKYNVNLKKLGKTPSTYLELIPGKKDYQKFQQLRDDKLVVKNNKLNKKTKTLVGIPQGSALSALLSNIYLVDYDEVMMEKAKSEGFVYRRYCDDIFNYL